MFIRGGASNLSFPRTVVGPYKLAILARRHFLEFALRFDRITSSRPSPGVLVCTQRRSRRCLMGRHTPSSSALKFAGPGQSGPSCPAVPRQTGNGYESCSGSNPPPAPVRLYRRETGHRDQRLHQLLLQPVLGTSSVVTSPLSTSSAKRPTGRSQTHRVLRHRAVALLPLEQACLRAHATGIVAQRLFAHSSSMPS